MGARSPEAYAHQVRRFLSWLGHRSPIDGNPRVDEAAHDWAVRDYKRHLKAVEPWKPRYVGAEFGLGFGAVCRRSCERGRFKDGV